jgi:integrase
MIQSGATVKDVQMALGHASAKMTLDVYGHWFDHGLDDISRRLDAQIVSWVG